MNNLDTGIVKPRFVFCLLLLAFTAQSFLIVCSLQDQNLKATSNPIFAIPVLGQDETLIGEIDCNSTENISVTYKNPTRSPNSVPQNVRPSSETFPIKADIRGSRWGDYSFLYRKNITIDHNKVSSDLPDFPVLVVLYDRDLRYHTQTEGNDIIFRDSSNNLLDYELEHYEATYNATHAFLVAWIRVPVLSSSTDTTISMYYGNSTISSQENATGVWNSSYKGVWHLGENGNGNTDEYKDSTQYLNHGTGGGSIPIQVSAEIGYAQEFDGSERYISIPSSSSLEFDTHLTIEAWVKIEGSSGDYMGIAGKLDDNDDNGYALVRHSNDSFRFWVGNGVMSSVDSDTTYTDSDWHHIVGVIDDGMNYLYIDGNLQTDTDSRDLTDSGYEAHIGRQYYNYDERFWDGIIDEVRISEISMSGDWITTEYNNQHDPTSFYTVGDEEGDLEVLIDTEVYDAIDEYNPGPNVVFINNSHGYVFMQKMIGGRAEIVYYKTKDNGSTWIGPTSVNPLGYGFRSFSCWYDQWTPKNYGTKIHFITNSWSQDLMMYNYLNTKDDTNGTWTEVMSSGGSHNAPDGGGAVTVSTDGVIFGASWMESRSQFAKFEQTSWSNITPSYSFLDDDDDHGQLLPLSGGDILCLYEDTSENTLYSFVYDEESDTWDTIPNNITTIVSETETPENDWNNNANWGAVSDPNTNNFFLLLNKDILSAQGVLESWEFFDSDRFWIQRSDVSTLGAAGDEVKPAYDPNSDTLFAIAILGKSIYVKNSTDRGLTWSASKKISSVTEEWIVLRTNFISTERIYAIYFDENDPDDDLVYGNTIADLPDPQGNATIEVNVVDLDNKKIPNARVNLIETDLSYEKTKNTSLNGFTSFTNVTFGYYNLTVEFEDTINRTYELQHFTSNSSYHLKPIISLLVIVSEYVDNSRPNVQNIYYENESSQFGDVPVFFADITDESSIREVNLNLTVIKTIGEETVIQANFTMVHLSGDQYYNATALDTLDDFNARAYYNIIAIDIAYNTIITEIKTVYLGDGSPPNIISYNVTDYKNGTLLFYANITDSMSEVYDPVLLQINDTFLIPMHRNVSGFWVATLQAYYNEQVEYTIYSANDTIGNENGSKLYILSPPYGLVVPGDNVLPNIITETVTSHYQGRVEFQAYINDHTSYQSGINASSVFLHINQSETIYTFPMIEIEELFQLELEFNLEDKFYYWVTAEDIAGNNNSGLLKGPFTIDDNSMPQISYWKIDWGNGTVDFYAEVIDWPHNETSAYLLFTQNYFSTWTNLTMTEISESSYFARVGSLEYDLQNLWYYVSATDTFNWNDPGISQASNFTLSDTISPMITYSIENSTENDGEITVFAYAIDPYGGSHFVNNTFYINFTYADSHNVMTMEYDSFYTYKKSYTFPVGEQVIISVWVGDNSGNLGTYSNNLTISDDAPPKIKNTGALVFQNGTVTIWTEVVDCGSGLYDDNSSIYLEYTHIYHHTVMMRWNGSGNFYTYSIQGFEPGTAFYFYLTAFDRSENHASTSPQEVLIFDETDPICIDYGYSETVLNQYSCSLNFWSEAYDPFGSIYEVNLTVTLYSDGSNSKIENVKMFNNGTHYVYSLTIKFNQSFTYSIMIYDEALNSIRIGDNFQQTSPFQSAKMIDYGILPSESDIGEVLFWCEIQDSFNSHNVTLLVKDETLNNWILNETMNSNRTHHNFLLAIEYLHNYSYTMRVIDEGVLEGYYEASQYIGFHQMSDYWEPTIHLAGIEKANDTTIIVWANVSDWGSGVSEVYLRYEISSQEQAGGYGAEIELERVPMIYNETYYIAEVSFSKTVTIEWFIEAYDSSYQSKSLTRSYTYLSPPPSIFDFIPAIIIAIVGTILVLSTLYAASAIYRKRKSQKLIEVIETREKLNSLLNTYVILVTTAVGLPVYNVSNIMYQSTNAIQDVLSGLSVGIDSFLESFQSDIVDFFLETDSDLFNSQTQDDIKTSIIEKNKVLIQIISSPSFRIFLFLKEKPPKYLKSAFISIARSFEEKIVLNELGVVDENFVGPIAEKVISQHFPLALLSPFQIDLQKLKVVEEKIKQGAPISKNISISAVNALKRLIIIKSNLDVSINDPQAQINLFDKSLAQNKLQNIPPLILNEALDIFKILKVSTKVIYKALWLGTDPTINIVVSHANIPREEIPIIE